MPDPSFTVNSLPRETIKKHFRSVRRKNVFDPANPSLTKTFSFQETDDGIVLNFVEGLFKAKLKNDGFFLRVVAHV